MDPMSDAALKAKLESDPAWVEAKERAERERRAEREGLTAGQEPLVEDLTNVGVYVQNVWDLLSSRTAPYRRGHLDDAATETVPPPGATVGVRL